MGTISSMALAKAAAAGLLAAGLAAGAQAQDAANYPSGTVTIVVPAAPGGNMDIWGRNLAEALSQELGGTVIVENVAGAGGATGAAAVAAAAPDGQTLLITTPGSMTIVPHLRSDLQYSPSDFAPVSQVARTAHVLVVNTDKIEATDLPELLELLRANPGAYNFSTGGVGSPPHIGAELFMARTGTEMTHISYRGGADAQAAILGGHVDVTVMAAATAMRSQDEPNLRFIAVLSPERIPQLPDVPSVAEMVPEYEGYYSWYGVFAPAGTPDDIQERIAGVVAEYVRQPEVVARAEEQAEGLVGSSPPEFAAMVERELGTWGDVVRIANIPVQ